MAANYHLTVSEAAAMFNNPNLVGSTTLGALCWKYIDGERGNGWLVDDPFPDPVTGTDHGTVLRISTFANQIGYGSTATPSGAASNIGFDVDSEPTDIYMAMDIAFPFNYIQPIGIHLAEIDVGYYDSNLETGYQQPDNVNVHFQTAGEGLLGTTNPLGLMTSYFYDINYWQAYHFWTSNNPSDPPRFGDVSGYDYMPLTLGKWHQLEHRLKLNTFTDGQPNQDGKFQAWMNNQLVLDLPGKIWTTQPGLYWKHSSFSTYHSGAGPTAPGGAVQDQYIYFDNIVISESRITG